VTVLHLNYQGQSLLIISKTMTEPIPTSSPKLHFLSATLYL